MLAEGNKRVEKFTKYLLARAEIYGGEEFAKELERRFEAAKRELRR